MEHEPLRLCSEQNFKKFFIFPLKNKSQKGLHEMIETKFCILQ